MSKSIVNRAILKAKEKDPTIRFHALSATNFDYSIIFSHEFARAFWTSLPVYDGFEKSHPGIVKAASLDGPEEFDAGYCKQAFSPEWQVRLKEMVLAEDPIAYLSEFI